MVGLDSFLSKSTKTRSLEKTRVKIKDYVLDKIVQPNAHLFFFFFKSFLSFSSLFICLSSMLSHERWVPW